MYIYQYRDHLGNVRVSFGRNNVGALEITDANDYYPFGMNHLKTGNSFYGQVSYKNYKYNGKELQETGMYDYGARFYMPDVVDPLAETSRLWNPYTYAFNNPMRFIDPDGMQNEDIITTILKSTVTKGADGKSQLIQRDINVKMTLTIVNLSGSDLSKTMFSKNSGTVSINEFEGTGISSFNNNSTVAMDNIKNFDVQYKVVTSIDDVGKNDHVLLIGNEVKNSDALGRGQNPGRVSAVEAGTIKNGTFNEVVKHEFGYNMGMKHSSNDKGLMKAEGTGANFCYSTTEGRNCIGGNRSPETSKNLFWRIFNFFGK